LSIYPNDKECMELLKSVGCSKRVRLHCCTVRAVAEAVAERIPCDRDLVFAGALLHDIGRSADHSIMHAYKGYRMLLDMGLPEELAEIVRKHTGAGLDQKDVEEFGLPPGDYIPATVEEKIVAHSDNLVSDSILVDHTYSMERLALRGHARGAARMGLLHKELSSAYGEDLDILVDRLGTKPVLIGPCAGLR
jgi:uncharacterized protein